MIGKETIDNGQFDDANLELESTVVKKRLSRSSADTAS